MNSSVASWKQNGFPKVFSTVWLLLALGKNMQNTGSIGLMFGFKQRDFFTGLHTEIVLQFYFYLFFWWNKNNMTWFSSLTQLVTVSADRRHEVFFCLCKELWMKKRNSRALRMRPERKKSASSSWVIHCSYQVRQNRSEKCKVECNALCGAMVARDGLQIKSSHQHGWRLSFCNILIYFISCKINDS